MARRPKPKPAKRATKKTPARAASVKAAALRNGIASIREPIRLLSDEDARALAHGCRDAALDKKAEGVMVLDIRDRATFADYFVLATGRSLLQARSIADGVVEAAEDAYGSPLRTEGYNDGSWILVDYGAVIVHVFTPQAREFYNLERLWGKLPPAAKKRV